MSEARTSQIQEELKELEDEMDKLDKASNAIRHEIRKLNDEYEQLEISKLVPFAVGDTIRFGLMGRYSVEPEKWARGTIVRFKGPNDRSDVRTVTLVVDVTSASGTVTCRKQIEYPDYNVCVVKESDFPTLIENMKQQLKSLAQFDEELAEAARKKIDRLKLEQQAVNMEEKIRVQKTLQRSRGVVSKDVRGKANKQSDSAGHGKRVSVGGTRKRSR